MAWPLNRLLAAPWFPLLGTFHSRQHWLYDICRFAGTRKLDVLFDVGANIGQTAREFKSFFPAATIHSFEPVRQTYASLVKNVGRWPNIRAHQLALGRRTERRDIFLQTWPELNSLSFSAPATESNGPNPSVEQIQVTSLDEFCRKNSIDAIDVLKTDAQGCDLDVLLGAQTLIAAARVAFVYSEVTFVPGDPHNSAFSPLHEHLLASGFQLAGFYEQCGFGRRQRQMWFCNALYSHPEALRRRWPQSTA